MQSQVRSLIRLAIEEDLGSGDLTSELTIPQSLEATGCFYAKERCILCGLPILELIAEELGWPLEFKYSCQDGALLEANTEFAYVDGPAQCILTAERIMLNFLQHLSGVATKAYALSHTAKNLTVLDTRKTTPGWRIIEKYAARIGGCVNHRSNLSEMILIKNNHIDANNGNISQLLNGVFKKKPLFTQVEVEVRNMEELQEAIKASAPIVMLDNMDNQSIKKALIWLKKNAPDTIAEISGQVDQKQLKELAEIGVKYVSTSAMITKSHWVDIAMRLVLHPEEEN